MQGREIHNTILRHLFYHSYIGGKHTARENALKGFPHDLRGEAERALRDLIRENLVIPKRTGYGEQISLNPRNLRQIRQILQP